MRKLCHDGRQERCAAYCINEKHFMGVCTVASKSSSSICMCFDAV